MRSRPLLSLMTASLMLASCASSGGAPVDVTRFHRAGAAEGMSGGSLAPGGYVIDTASPYSPQGLEGSLWSDAVSRELDKLGFRRESAAAPAYVVTIRHQRDTLDSASGRRGSPVSVGVGGSTGRYGSGLGVGIGINLSGPPKSRIADELAVQIGRRADRQVVWEGRASSEARQGSSAAQPGIMAAKMAEALFRGFPGDNGKSIRIP